MNMTAGSSKVRPGTLASTLLWKGGITFRKDHRFDVSLTAVYASDQYW